MLIIIYHNHIIVVFMLPHMPLSEPLDQRILFISSWDNKAKTQVVRQVYSLNSYFIPVLSGKLLILPVIPHRKMLMRWSPSSSTIPVLISYPSGVVVSWCRGVVRPSSTLAAKRPRLSWRSCKSCGRNAKRTTVCWLRNHVQPQNVRIITSNYSK